MKETKAEIEYNGKKADIDDPQKAEELAGEIIKDINHRPAIAKKPVIIELGPIVDVGIKFKNKETIISLATMMNPGDIARLANLYRQGAPLTATVQSLQAEFDLQFMRVDTGTGEMR